MNIVAKLCVWLAILCVVGAVPLALTVVWADEYPRAFTPILQTLAVVFIAASLVLAVVRMVAPHGADGRR